MNEAKLNEFMGQVVADLAGFVGIAMTYLGNRLGLWKAMAGAGPLTATEIAKKCGCNERLVQEWLSHQAAGKYITYDASTNAFQLPDEHAFALANTESPVFVAEGVSSMFSLIHDLDKIEKAFKGDGALAWGDHHHSLFHGTAEFFRPGYRAFTVDAWLPALHGVVDKLKAGGRVADIGCGFGTSTTIMAKAFPQSKFFGFDSHGPSIEGAKKEAVAAGVGDRATFATHNAKDFPRGEGYDLICFFDALHDMPDPVGAAKYALGQLAPGGAIMLVEPFADDNLAGNLHPLGRLFYGASTFLCTPNALTDAPRAGLGAQAGEARMKKVFEEAGCKSFRRATQTPFNIVYEAR
jgi:SAM-dependent methyltransferase